MKRLRADGFDVPSIIRDALNNTLGELATQAALSYTGDASDGDFGAFVQRAEELFRTSAPMVFTAILWWIGRGVPLPHGPPRPAATKRSAQRTPQRPAKNREEVNRPEDTDIPDWRPAQRSFGA